MEDPTRTPSDASPAAEAERRSRSVPEAASFRDPHGRVFYVGDRVLRALSTQGLADWDAFVESGLAAELAGEGKLVATQRVDDTAAVELPHGLAAQAVLEHERIPFVSYPYEWPFGMLRDAALLQLELLERAVPRGLILKDATPYNVQWRGPRPVFVDVGSFERLREGEAWTGYRQFCQLFLYPLLLYAWKGVRFQPWLRGSLEGIAPGELRALLSARDLLRRGALTHVVLHSRLERRYADRGGEVKQELRAAGFGPELIAANARRLTRLISRLHAPRRSSAWSEYGATTSYSPEDAERKERFVAAAAADAQPALCWDVGCNEARHARIAARHAGAVVAMDADHVVVDRLYDALSSEGVANVLPLTIDAVDPSPDLGWRATERSGIQGRGRPDLTLCLAVLHHVAVGRNVPVADIVAWLHDLTDAAVVEFAAPEDPMVQRLLARKRPDDHPDYRRDWFERCLLDRFQPLRREELAGGERVLYHVRARR